MEKKQILFVISGVQFHKSEGALNRLNTFIDSYKKNGYEVDVLLFYSLLSFKYLFSKKKYLNKNAKWKLYPNLPVSKYSWLLKISRNFNSFIFYIVSRIKNYKIIQLEIQGYVAKYKPKRSYLITDFHGDLVSEETFKNNNKENWLSQWYLQEQKKSVIYSDLILVVSSNLKFCLEENTGYEINNYDIISCLPDLNRFEHPKKNLIPEFKDRIVIGYIGGLQKWQNIDKILALITALNNIDKNIIFALFTNDDTLKFKSAFDSLGTDNYFVKSLNKTEVPEYLKLLDVGLLLRENLKLNVVSSPTKTAEYLAAGVPFICTQYSGDYTKYLINGNEGFVLDNISFNDNDITNLLNYIRQIKKNRDDFSNLCKQSVSNFSWINTFNKLIIKIDDNLTRFRND